MIDTQDIIDEVQKNGPCVAYHVHKLEDMLVNGPGNNQFYDINSGVSMRQIKDGHGFTTSGPLTPHDLNMAININDMMGAYNQNIDNVLCTHNGVQQQFNIVLADLMNTMFKMDQKIEELKTEITILKVSKRKEAYVKSPVVENSARADGSSVHLRRPIKENNNESIRTR